MESTRMDLEPWSKNVSPDWPQIQSSWSDSRKATGQIHKAELEEGQSQSWEWTAAGMWDKTGYSLPSSSPLQKDIFFCIVPPSPGRQAAQKRWNIFLMSQSILILYKPAAVTFLIWVFYLLGRYFCKWTVGCCCDEMGPGRPYLSSSWCHFHKSWTKNSDDKQDVSAIGIITNFFSSNIWRVISNGKLPSHWVRCKWEYQ